MTDGARIAWDCIDHVQVCCPPGGEERARAFYGALLGLPEVDKPHELRGRGGCWFRVGSTGLHIGAHEPFVPADRAHPALRLASMDDYDRLLARVRAAGYTVTDGAPPVADARSKVVDPFGNLIELVVGTTG